MNKNNNQIELLYFRDCPSWKNAFETLEKALTSYDVDTEIQIMAVETQEDAEANKFTGSPMIRVNGNELFPSDQNSYALGCRVYQTPEGLKGWPTAEMLAEKLQSVFDLK